MYSHPQTIFEALRQERDDFLNTEIELVEGLPFNQYATVKKIHKYHNSHYEQGNYETINGIRRKKVFWNISKWRCDTATKMLDVDVRDFLLISENPATELNVYLLEKELKAWLKKHRLGKVLNEVTRRLPVYGSVVLKKVKDGAEIVDLRYLFNDQAASSLKESRYVVQKHLMSAGELRKMTAWEGVDEVIERYCNFAAQSYETDDSYQKAVGSPYAEVWERYGECPLSWFTDNEKDDDTYVLSRFVVAGIDDRMTNEAGEAVGENGVVLFKERIKELPFKEVHYNRTEGRWLGIGVVEDCFEDQRQINRVKDQEAKAMELSSLILFQTRDQLVQKNLLSDVDNGEVLKVGSEITRLDNSNRALPEFQRVADAYEMHANKMTFSSDLLSGEQPPASTTATAVMNQVQQAASVYDYKKENIGLFLQEFIEDLVFPELEGEINEPHLFRFTGSIPELEKMRERAIDGYLRSKILESGDVPTAEEYAAEKQRLLQDYRKLGDKLWLKTQRDFFRNLEYEISLEITGEGKNVQAQMNNLQFVFGIIGKNPAVLQNPVLKRLLFKVMSLMGMSVSELENAESEMSQQGVMPQIPPGEMPAQPALQPSPNNPTV